MSNQAAKEEILKILSGCSQLFFSDTLPIPAIKVRGRNRFAMRFFSGSFEIVLGTLLPHTPPRIILDEVIHQACHVYNHIHSIKDSSNYQYHNKNFAKQAIKCGLYVARDNMFGWLASSEINDFSGQGQCDDLGGLDCPCKNGCVLHPDEEILELREGWYDRLLKEIDFDIFKQIKFKDKSPKNYFLKYECGCDPPYNSIRSGRRPDKSHALRVRCEDCGELFRCVEPGIIGENGHAESHGSGTKGTITGAML